MNTIEELRKNAKHWLREVRRGNAGQVKRLRLTYPDAPATPGLRHIQHALARERGYASWRALRAAVEHEAHHPKAPGSRVETSGVSELAARFLDLACWDDETHGRGMFALREAAAMRLLEDHPEVAHQSLYTAVVCADFAAVERLLRAQPELAGAKGGARGWEPLLYLCYARLPLSSLRSDAVAIARLLFECGADPNAYYMAGDAVYGALVGVAGEGEQDAPAHPSREALYRVVLEHGAEPFDIQVLYNTHFRGDVRWWLELTYDYTVRTGHAAPWADNDWPMLDMGGYGSGARFLLWIAIEKHDVGLAEWLLAHGANPNAPPARAPHFSKRSVYDDAMDAGCGDIAMKLQEHGGTADPSPVDDERAYVSAVLRLDRGAAQSLLARHPEYVRSPKALFAAARANRVQAIELLLSLGVSPDVEDEQGARALHRAAAANACDAAAALLARGADPDARERQWHATPLGFASHHDHREMVALLAPVSHDVWNLAQNGYVDQLREVLTAVPALGRGFDRRGCTPLWWLPPDDNRAVQVVELFLASGVDPAHVAPDGSTAEALARRRGLNQAAARLAAAAGMDSDARIASHTTPSHITGAVEENQ